MITLAPPELEFISRMRLEIEPSISVGETLEGNRMFSAIGGGYVDGPFFSGEIIRGGTAWITEFTPDFCEVDAQYVVKTKENALIEVQAKHHRFGQGDIVQQAFHQENVSSDLYSMHASVRLSSAHEKFKWLNYRVFLANARRDAVRVTSDIYTLV